MLVVRHGPSVVDFIADVAYGCRLGLGWIMKSLIETAAMIAGCASAVCWFASAMWHLPRVKPGIDESDRATEFSNRLQQMSRWNFWAAGLMGVTALLSVWARSLG